MASTQAILDEAKKLGELIKEHEAVKKMDKVVKQLQEDVEAQRILNDYNRFSLQIAEKEQKGEPIEVDEKHKAAELHKAVVMNKLLQDLQIVQMDYSDLLRQVDATMMNEISPAPTPAPGTPGSAPGSAPGSVPGSAGTSESAGGSTGGNGGADGESPIIQ